MFRNCLAMTVLLSLVVHSAGAVAVPETHEIKITNPQLNSGEYVRGLYNVESKTVRISYCASESGPCSAIGPHSFYNLEELTELTEWYEGLSSKSISISVPILTVIASASLAAIGVGKYYGVSLMDLVKTRVAGLSIVTGISVGGAGLWVKDLVNFARYRLDFILTYHNARALRFFTELDHITRDHTLNDISAKDFAARLDGALRNLK